MEQKRKREQNATRTMIGNSNNSHSSPSVFTASTLDQRSTSASTTLPRIHSGPLPPSFLDGAGQTRRGTASGLWPSSSSSPMKDHYSNISSDGHINVKVFKGEMRKKKDSSSKLSETGEEDWMTVGTIAPNTNTSGGGTGSHNAGTRQVPYTITNSTTSKELIHIIKTLQEELDQRTISVNAIQRNFERLGTMYKANQEELERLREALQQCQSEAQTSNSEEKLLGAMKLELESLMHRHEVLKAELEEQCKVSSERQYQFELETQQQKELMQVSQQKITALSSELEQKNKEIEQMFNDNEKKIKNMEIVQRQREMELTEGNNQRRASIETLLRTVVELYSTHTSSVLAPYLEQIQKAHTGNGPVTSTSFTLRESQSALEQWVDLFQVFLRAPHDQLKDEKRKDLQEHERWSVFSIGLLQNTLEEHKQGVGKPILEFTGDVLYRFTAFRHQIAHDFRKRTEQSQHTETQLRSEIQKLQQASGEDRQDLLALHNVEVSSLKEQLLLISEQLNAKCDALRLVEMERDQAMDASRVNKMELEKALANLKSNEQDHAEEINKMREKHREEINKAQLDFTHQQSKREEELQKHIRALQANLQAALEQSQVSSKSLLAEHETLVISLQKKVISQFEALFESFRSVENSARRSIMHEEGEERQMIYAESHKRITERKLKWIEAIWKIQEGESLARADLKLEEVTHCAGIVFSLSSAIHQESNEIRWKSKITESERKEEHLRHQFTKKEKECIALREEHKKDLARISKNFEKELSEAKLLENRCNTLEQELRNAKVEIEKQHVDAFQIQKSTMASVQCLIAAEEASESTYSCPLCFQLFQQPLTCTPCGHTFCENCIKKHPRNLSVFKGDNSGLNSGHMKASFFCPECRSHCCDGLLETKCILDLSSKFQYKKKILRDIVTSLQRVNNSTSLLHS